ncbi:MAG TPA: hypothetical protein VF143_08245 [Candidatus Nanopelagicales bacterium]
MRRLTAVVLLAGAPIVLVPAVAVANPGPEQPNVSNMGYCSSLLAQQPGVGGLAPTARAEVNQILRLYGDRFGIPSPGALYSVRARMTLAEDAVCQQR